MLVWNKIYFYHDNIQLAFYSIVVSILISAYWHQQRVDTPTEYTLSSMHASTSYIRQTQSPKWSLFSQLVTYYSKAEFELFEFFSLKCNLMQLSNFGVLSVRILIWSLVFKTILGDLKSSSIHSSCCQFQWGLHQQTSYNRCIRVDTVYHDQRNNGHSCKWLLFRFV